MYAVEMSLVGLLVAVELGLDLFERKSSRLRDQKILEGHSSPSNGRKLPRGTICVRNMMVFLFLGSYCTCKPYIWSDLQEEERFAKRLTLRFEGCCHDKV